MNNIALMLNTKLFTYMGLDYTVCYNNGYELYWQSNERLQARNSLSKSFITHPPAQMKYDKGCQISYSRLQIIVRDSRNCRVHHLWFHMMITYHG